METLEKKGKGSALLPFLLFIVIYLGAGLYFQAQGVEMAFYQFPSVTAMFIALLLAFCQGKGTIDQKFTVFAKGAANENVLTMLMIYILAGAFSTVASAMGGVDATVNLGLSVIPVHFLAAGVFVISAFMGTATGTSMGTISAIVPIAVGVAEKGGLSLPLFLGACVGGAMFGDNLSMISDTTIAATRTQGCQLRDKFRVNFLIALPAAIITIIVLLVVGRPETVTEMGNLSFNVIKVIPYLAVLVLALIGMNVFLVLTIGIFAAGIIGLALGDLDIPLFAQSIWNGFTGMNEVFFLSLFCGGMSEMIAHNGGITWLIEKLGRMMKGNKSAQVGVAALVSLADCATANNTVAIIVSGPMAKNMSRIHKVDPRRTASLLDVFSCVLQGMIPWGAQLLTAASLTTIYGVTMNPIDILPYMWYCWILAAVGILSIFIPFADGICRKDPWNWEYDVAESGVAAKKASLELERQESAQTPTRTKGRGLVEIVGATPLRHCDSRPFWAANRAAVSKSARFRDRWRRFAGFPSSFAGGKRRIFNPFPQGVYLPKIPRLSRLGRRSPVCRLTGGLHGGAGPPWKAVTRALPRTSSGTPPGPPRPPWAWHYRWTPAGRPRSCGPSGCRSRRPWRRPPHRHPAPCWG